MRQRDVAEVLNKFSRSTNEEVRIIGRFIHEMYDDIAAIRRQIKEFESCMLQFAATIDTLTNYQLQVKKDLDARLEGMRTDNKFGITVSSEDASDD